ncbi:MAG: tyrosine-type recombinase/integrase [Ignavibacteriaceae bacterium]|nr:tyrosine-type recombinase/integrase [Ignavibacteriaceae bacterium]
MATLYKKRGWWFIDYALGGKRVTKNTKLEATETNKAKAEKLKSDIENVIDERLRLSLTTGTGGTNDITLNQALKKYSTVYVEGKSSSHIDTFDYVMRLFKTIVPGGINVKYITVENVKNFVVLMKKSLAPASQVTYFQYLASFLGYLKVNGHIEEIPIGKGIRPKKAVKNIISFDPRDLELILELAKADENKYYLAFKMFLLTGQRPGDVLKLQVRDIDFHRKIVYFRISKTASEFKFPIYAQLEVFLRNEFKLSENSDKDTYLFPGVTVNAAGKAFRRIKKKLGFNKRQYYTLKTFRKNFATSISRMGMSIQEVQALLDHKSPITTLRYYADVKSEELKDKLDKLLK